MECALNYEAAPSENMVICVNVEVLRVSTKSSMQHAALTVLCSITSERYPNDWVVVWSIRANPVNRNTCGLVQ